MGLNKIIAANSIYRILNTGIQLVITMLLSRLMGIEGFGLLSLAIATVAIFNMVTSLGLDSAITYHIASGKLNLQHINWVIGIVLLIQVVLAVVADTTVYLYAGRHLLAFSLPVLLIFVLSTSITEKITSLFNGLHFYTLLNRWLVISNAAMMLVWFILWFTVNTWSPEVYLCLYVSLMAMQTLVLVIIFISKAQNNLSLHFPGRTQLKFFATYASIEYLANLLQFIAFRADYWILDFFYNKKELGWYALAVKLAQFFWVIPTLASSILFPVISNQLPAAAINNITQLIRIMNWVNLLLMIFIAGVAGWVIPFVFGEQFAASTPVMMWLLPGYWLYSITVVLGAYFSGINRPEITLYSAVFVLVSVLIADFIMIPVLGKTGAAMASSIAYSLTAFYNIYIYCSLTNQSALKLFWPEKNDIEKCRQIVGQ